MDNSSGVIASDKDSNNDFKNSRQKCGYCFLTFDSQQQLVLHLKMHTFICIKCHQTFYNEKALESHMSSQHPKKKWLCKFCDKQFLIRSRLEEHLQSHLSLKPFKCDRCGKNYSRLSYLKIHKCQHLANDTFDCSQCPQKFSNRSKLSKHLQHVHETLKTHKCMLCPMEFLDLQSLELHVDSHASNETDSPLKSLLCQFCQEEFTTEDKLSQHLGTHAVRNSGLDKKKLRVNSKKDQFQCKICSKTFLKLTNLNNHLKCHSENVQWDFFCSLCPNEKFICEELLLKHRKFVHKEKTPFVCKYCQKKFLFHSVLTLHLRTHTGEKPFCCSHCNKSFSQLSSLKVHIKRHKKQAVLSSEKIVQQMNPGPQNGAKCDNMNQNKAYKKRRNNNNCEETDHLHNEANAPNVYKNSNGKEMNETDRVRIRKRGPQNKSEVNNKQNTNCETMNETNVSLSENVSLNPENIPRFIHYPEDLVNQYEENLPAISELSSSQGIDPNTGVKEKENKVTILKNVHPPYDSSFYRDENGCKVLNNQCRVSLTHLDGVNRTPLVDDSSFYRDENGCKVLNNQCRVSLTHLNGVNRTPLVDDSSFYRDENGCKVLNNQCRVSLTHLNGVNRTPLVDDSSFYRDENGCKVLNNQCRVSLTHLDGVNRTPLVDDSSFYRDENGCKVLNNQCRVSLTHLDGVNRTPLVDDSSFYRDENGCKVLNNQCRVSLTHLDGVNRTPLVDDSSFYRDENGCKVLNNQCRVSLTHLDGVSWTPLVVTENKTKKHYEGPDLAVESLLDLPSNSLNALTHSNNQCGLNKQSENVMTPFEEVIIIPVTDSFNDDNIRKNSYVINFETDLQNRIVGSEEEPCRPYLGESHMTPDQIPTDAVAVNHSRVLQYLNSQSREFTPIKEANRKNLPPETTAMVRLESAESPDLIDLTDEINDTETNLFFPCSICKNVLLHANELNDHMKSHTVVKPFVCGYCQKSFQYSCDLKRHVNQHKKQIVAPFSCTHCSKRFPSLNSFVLHQQMHKKECRESNETQLKHIDSSAPDLNTPDNFSHLRSTTLENAENKSGDASKTELWRHSTQTENIIEQKSSRLLTCEYCGKVFRYRSLLNQHLDQHTGKKPFNCPTCKKSFTRISFLKVHQKRHQSRTSASSLSSGCVVPFSCVKQSSIKVSSPSSSSVVSLPLAKQSKTKVLSLSPGSVVSLPLAKQSKTKVLSLSPGSVVSLPLSKQPRTKVSSPSSASVTQKLLLLTKKQNTIKNEKSFDSNSANQSFAKSCNLRNTRQRQRRFICEFCKKEFPYRSQLAEHLPKHTGEKAFTCRICKKSYRNFSYLRIHLNKCAKKCA